MSHRYWVDQQPILVDEAGGYEVLRKARTAVRYDVLARLQFQFLNLICQVTRGYIRMGPVAGMGGSSRIGR